MLLEFYCSNFKSIKEEVLFSMLASTDDSYENNVRDISGTRVLRSAAIYGPNGSGKSNLIEAIGFVRNLVCFSAMNCIGEEVDVKAHKLLGNGEASEFKMQFISNGIRYYYGFAVRGGAIVWEYLYHFPNGRSAKVFERTDVEEFTEGSAFRGKFGFCRETLAPNRLLLSCAFATTRSKAIGNARDFLVNKLIVHCSHNTDCRVQDFLLGLDMEPGSKKHLAELLQAFGVPVKKIKIVVDGNGEDSVHDAVLDYGTFKTSLLCDESEGMKRLFLLLGSMMEAVQNEGVLISDDLDAGIHENVLRAFLMIFPKLGACQLVFTTHDTALLSAGLLRRDQIWMTESDKKTRATRIYSLCEINGVRKTENLALGYVLGRYGAVPEISDELSKRIAEIFRLREEPAK